MLELWYAMASLGGMFFLAGMVTVFWPSNEKQQIAQQQADQLRATQAKGRG